MCKKNSIDPTPIAVAHTILVGNRCATFENLSETATSEGSRKLWHDMAVKEEESWMGALQQSGLEPDDYYPTFLSSYQARMESIKKVSE